MLRLKNLITERLRMTDIFALFSDKHKRDQIKAEDFSKLFLDLYRKYPDDFERYDNDVIIVDSSKEDSIKRGMKYIHNYEEPDPEITNRLQSNEAIAYITDEMVDPMEGIFFAYVSKINSYAIYNKWPDYVTDGYSYVYEEDVSFLKATSLLDKTFKFL